MSCTHQVEFAPLILITSLLLLLICPVEFLNSQKWCFYALLQQAESLVEIIVKIVIKQLLLVDKDVDLLNVASLLLPVDGVIF